MNHLLEKVYAIMALAILLTSSMFSWVSYAAITGSVSPFFIDIDASFAKSDIEDFAMRGIVAWYRDGTFMPESSITRAEFLAIVMGELQINVDNITSTPFRDIPSGDGAWILAYAEKARQLGIAYGQTIGGVLRFRPNDSITRAEALIMLFRAANISVDMTQKTTVFQDIPDYQWWVLIPYVERARQLNIIQGQVIGGVLRFRPNATITRAESVRMIMRASSL